MGLTLCISPTGLIFHRRHGEDGPRRDASECCRKRLRASCPVAVAVAVFNLWYPAVVELDEPGVEIVSIDDALPRWGRRREVTIIAAGFGPTIWAGEAGVKRGHLGREMVGGGMAGWPGGTVDLIGYLTLKGRGRALVQGVVVSAISLV